MKAGRDTRRVSAYIHVIPAALSARLLNALKATHFQQPLTTDDSCPPQHSGLIKTYLESCCRLAKQANNSCGDSSLSRLACSRFPLDHRNVNNAFSHLASLIIIITILLQNVWLTRSYVLCFPPFLLFLKYKDLDHSCRYANPTMGRDTDASSWLSANTPSRATTRLGRLRLKTPRPVISAPMGPIKNSRGPDFSRSKTFVIVDGIKDCVSPVKKEARRTISAGYRREALSSKPTVAESDVVAKTGIQAPLCRRSANELRKASREASPKLPKPSLKTSSTFTVMPRIESPPDENTPPSHFVSRTKPASPSKIPMSRTMNVLHDLKTSISRTSLNTRAGPTKIPDQASSASSRSTVMPSLSSKLRLPSASQTSLCPSPRSCTPEPDPFCVDEAQPSAYWSGRFMSLWDKFSSELLNPIPQG